METQCRRGLAGSETCPDTCHLPRRGTNVGMVETPRTGRTTLNTPLECLVEEPRLTSDGAPERLSEPTHRRSLITTDLTEEVRHHLELTQSQQPEERGDAATLCNVISRALADDQGGCPHAKEHIGEQRGRLWQISFESLELRHKLGQGQFGEVFMAL